SKEQSRVTSRAHSQSSRTSPMLYRSFSAFTAATTLRSPAISTPTAHSCPRSPSRSMWTDRIPLRLKTAMLLSGALVFTVGAAVSARAQVRKLEMFQGSILPATAELSALRQRISVLTSQKEASEEQHLLSGG